MNLIEFIDEANQAKTVEELTQKLMRFLAQFGYDQFIMSDMSFESTIKREAYHGMVVNFSPVWQSHYIKNHYVENDPLYSRILTEKKPFSWRSVREDSTLSKVSRDILDEAKDYNLAEGIALALHQPQGRVIGMGFAGRHSDVEYSVSISSQINAAANHFFVIYNDLTGWDKLEHHEDPNVTPREKDILYWLSKGKSRVDIADICKISESTINRHCENIFVKLNVSNVAAAIAKAIRLRLIPLYLLVFSPVQVCVNGL